jgi:hypothetical protein
VGLMSLKSLNLTNGYPNKNNKNNNKVKSKPLEIGSRVKTFVLKNTSKRNSQCEISCNTEHFDVLLKKTAQQKYFFENLSFLASRTSC